MKAILGWFRRLTRNGSAPESNLKQKIGVPAKVSYMEDFSPTVPDLQLLQEFPAENDVSFGFDPYDTADISRE